jgi:hypothetical protein
VILSGAVLAAAIMLGFAGPDSMAQRNSISRVAAGVS